MVLFPSQEGTDLVQDKVVYYDFSKEFERADSISRCFSHSIW